MALPVQGPPPWPPSPDPIHRRASSSRHPPPTLPIQTNSLSQRQSTLPHSSDASSQTSGPRRQSSESTRSSARCWCGEREWRRRGTGSAGALAVSAARAAAVVGLAAGWATGASATPAGHLTPRQRDKSRAIDDPLHPIPASSPLLAISISPPSHPAGPTPPPTAPVLLHQPQPTLRKRLLPKYEYESGSWVIDRTWTLRGSVGRQGTARVAATAMEDNVYSLLSSSSVSTVASSTRPSTEASVTPTSTRSPTNAQRNSSPSKTVLIPSGWQATPRETSYYAVPIIIAMSVLVAVVVVGAILGSVFWRRKKRRRRDVEKDALVPEKGWRGIVQKAVHGSGGRRKGRKKSKRKARAVEEDPAAMATGVDAANDARSVQDSVGSGGSAGGSVVRRVRTIGFAAGNRVQPRRRRRRAQGGDEGGEAGTDDESAALTRTGSRSTTSSATPDDTLIARLARRLRRSSRTEDETAEPSTVFSHALTARSSSTLSAAALSQLSRTSTRTSTRSSLGPPPLTHPPPQIFFTPADDPALQPLAPSSSAVSLSRTPSRTSSVHSVARVPVPSPALETLPLAPASLPIAPAAFNALLSSDADLALPLAPGPPAYRPSSSTVQTTRRFGAGDLPATAPGRAAGGAAGRLVGRGRRRARQPQRAEEEDEGEWHWPGEKGRDFAGFGGASTSAAGPSAGPSAVGDEPAAAASPFDDGEEEDEPPLDPSMYTAHLATDDKAILARLRNATFRATGVEGDDVGAEDEPPAAYAEAGPSAQPSAPPVEEVEDDEVDEDGFERFVPQEEEQQEDEDEEANIGTSTTAVPASPSLLPAPPNRVLFSYPYLSSSTPSSSRPPSSTSTSLAPPSSPASTAPTSSASTSKSALAAEYAALSDGQEQDEEELDLPVYLPRAGNGALGMASAPPVLEDDDEDPEEEEEDEDEDEPEMEEERYPARRTPEA
ncbi:hypothetical protein JCM5296_005049 [Sporobolomyces johnsonii]